MTGAGWNIVILGLSITSSRGDGHATAYRGLVLALVARGHRVIFLERTTASSAEARDLTEPRGARIELYNDLPELKSKHHGDVRSADVVIIGSFVPEGTAVGEWALETAEGVVAFYDMDTPITLSKILKDDAEYLSPALIPRYHLYLSFTGGPTLERIAKQFGSPMARPLYYGVDASLYLPEEIEKRWDLGFLGTYSADRQPALQELLVEPASHWPTGKFAVAGSLYPPLPWPENIERIEHLPPAECRTFYGQQAFTLSLTRTEMIDAGYSPSARLFEAAACGTAVISDYWEGLEEFFEAGEELLVARTSEQVLHYLRGIPRAEAREIGAAARRRVLAHHTAEHRAKELENYLKQVMGRSDAGLGPDSTAPSEPPREPAVS